MSATAWLRLHLTSLWSQLSIVALIRKLVDTLTGSTNGDVQRSDVCRRDPSSASLFPEIFNINNELLQDKTARLCSLNVQIGQKDAADPHNDLFSVAVDPKGSELMYTLNNSIPNINNNPSSEHPVSVSNDQTYQLQASSTGAEANVPSDNGEVYVCHYCDAKFRIRGYLTRHIKKHAIEKAHRCPFYNPNVESSARCHSSGGFSRRDTYKTHLRARHFIYPHGVKPQDRNKSSGYCGQCGCFFERTDLWVEDHIESGQCRGLPDNYMAQMKNQRKLGRLKKIKTSNGMRFVSTAQSVMDTKILKNKDALEALAVVASTHDGAVSQYSKDKLIIDTEYYQAKNKNEANSRTEIKNEAPTLLRTSHDFISSQPSDQMNLNNTMQNTIIFEKFCKPVKHNSHFKLPINFEGQYKGVSNEHDANDFIAPVPIANPDMNNTHIPLNIPKELEQRYLLSDANPIPENSPALFSEGKPTMSPMESFLLEPISSASSVFSEDNMINSGSNLKSTQNERNQTKNNNEITDLGDLDAFFLCEAGQQLTPMANLSDIQPAFTDDFKGLNNTMDSGILNNSNFQTTETRVYNDYPRH